MTFTGVVGLVSVLLPALPGPAPASGRPAPATGAHARATAFALFAQPVVVLNANRVMLTIGDAGDQGQPGASVFGFNYWPGGTPDRYVFNGGLQVAAIIPGVDSPDFPWPGDTVGAFFYDARGTQQHGFALTPIYDSRRDLADWPSAALVGDPTLFTAALLGQQTASEQDTWVRYWDGDTDTTQDVGRPHPMGLLVEQRTLAWNYPLGNDDIVYFIYRLINMTTADPARYDGLAALGYAPADIVEIAQLGRIFRDRMRASFDVDIPDSGYTFSRMYVGYGQDPDVGNASFNYATASLPFGLMAAYKQGFAEASWQYPSTVFHPPFAHAPGFVAEAFLRTPGPAGDANGITLFTNAAGFARDPRGVPALWRMLSGNFVANLERCSVPLAEVQVRHFCYAFQQANDARGYLSSTALTLRPGEAVTLVMAQIYAAAVAAPIAPHIDGYLAPGFPLSGVRLVEGLDTVRTIDRAMGWVSHVDADGDGAIGFDEVTTVPRSLLWKTQVAHAVLDAGFLLPSAPEPPAFFVVPGDGRVTVVWRPSATEQTGDPYFAVASNPATPLYDPDFREYDVEGYRVWRGTSPATMTLMAQFDYDGTAITDHTGLFTAYGNECAPELDVTATCPTFPHSIPLAGDIVQVRPGDRILGIDGSVALLRADTAITGGHSGRPGLVDGRVPFAYVVSTVSNGVPVFYAVTAFDVNSYRSGPSSLESPLALKVVTPRIPSGQEHGGGVGPLELLAGDGSVLDLTASLPTLDAATGIFSGPMPPTDGAQLGFLTLLPRLLDSGAVTVTIDSIVPATAFGSGPAEYYLTSLGAGSARSFTLALTVDPYAAFRSADVQFMAATVDAATAARFGGNETFPLPMRLTLGIPGNYRLAGKGRASAVGNPAGPNNGPRWWAGSPNENTRDPNGINCGYPPFTCILTDLSRNAGAMPGVDIFNIQAYSTVPSFPARIIENIASSVSRAADFAVYWGAVGAVDSVIDVTHRVPVPFHTDVRASWGFLTDASFTGFTGTPADGDNALLTWTDYACIAPLPRYLGICGGVADAAAAKLQRSGTLSPVGFRSSAYGATAATGGATGNGFLFYISGNFFLMQMAALPPAGTVWHLRTYAGNITGAPGDFAFQSAVRPPNVPGLRLRLHYTGTTLDPSVTTDTGLARMHTVPDPYYLGNTLETLTGRQMLRFVNVPARAIIRIYSTSGILVAMVSHNDVMGGGEAEWDLRNRNGRPVASGVYFYHVVTPDGRQKIGRFTVVNGSH